MTIQDLVKPHPYYCSETNYYDNNTGHTFRAWGEFLEDYENADMDYNLLFRWDIYQHNDEKPELGHYMQLFFIGQKQGKFWCINVDNVFDRDAQSIHDFLKVRKDYLLKLWTPID